MVGTTKRFRQPAGVVVYPHTLWGIGADLFSLGVLLHSRVGVATGAGETHRGIGRLD